ncbi:glycosyltransferase family 2 protein [Pediococcus parvulus]|nr:glycosyltransferase [Pediococcus parvulus]
MAFEQTIKSVNRILQLVGEKKIIIVDNASPNDSSIKLKEEFRLNEDVIFIQNKTNLGFAKGNNIGYKYAKINFDPKFVVVMNSDVLIGQNNFIQLVDESFNRNSFDIMGPDIVTFYGGFHQNPMKQQNYNLKRLQCMKRKLVLKNHLKLLYWIKWRILNKHPKKRKQNVSKRKIKEVKEGLPLHGSFYVFSTNFLKKNDSCFYAETFMYMEAQILYYQAMKKKYKVIYDPSVIVTHIDDVSTDLTFSNRYKKAVFSNKALLDSVRAFIKLIEG